MFIGWPFPESKSDKPSIDYRHRIVWPEEHPIAFVFHHSIRVVHVVGTIQQLRRDVNTLIDKIVGSPFCPAGLVGLMRDPSSPAMRMQTLGGAGIIFSRIQPNHNLVFPAFPAPVYAIRLAGVMIPAFQP